jgi:hypothetical protein
MINVLRVVKDIWSVVYPKYSLTLPPRNILRAEYLSIHLISSFCCYQNRLSRSIYLVSP